MKMEKPGKIPSLVRQPRPGNSGFEILDTFPEFVKYQTIWQSGNIDKQISTWKKFYLSIWPDILKMQLACYEEDGEDWERIARGRIFPELAGRHQKMQTAHDNLLKISPAIIAQSKAVLGCDLNPVIIIYVGIGCGAGWATTYQGQPAILLGVENIAEEGWQDEGHLRGLVAHEMGHLVHACWRGPTTPAEKKDPCWQLYSEGFAQCCEDLVNGKPWHMADIDWMNWCERNLKKIARDFLLCLKSGASTRPFFGSWYAYQGYRQTGYYLGHALIRKLGENRTLEEIAGLKDVRGEIFSQLVLLASLDSHGESL
jgi:hypothetical protein